MASRLLSMECMVAVQEPTVPFNVEMMGDDLSLWTPICFDLSKGHCYDDAYFSCSWALFIIDGFKGAKVSYAKVGARHCLIKSLGGCVEMPSIGGGLMFSLVLVTEGNSNHLFTISGVGHFMRWLMQRVHGGQWWTPTVHGGYMWTS